MVDFGSIILAHLIGDFVFQNDWVAKQKTSSSIVCVVHAVLYTSAFVLIIEQLGGWPAWAYVAIAVGHFPIDRYGLARKFMVWNGQSEFSDKLGPWSVIIVDNTFHLYWAWVIWTICKK